MQHPLFHHQCVHQSCNVEELVHRQSLSCDAASFALVSDIFVLVCFAGHDLSSLSPKLSPIDVPVRKMRSDRKLHVSLLRLFRGHTSKSFEAY